MEQFKVMEKSADNSIINGMAKVKEDTIAAISTPNGIGGIAVIRISGPDALKIVDSAWRGKKLQDCPSHTLHLGKYVNTDGEILDECVASIYRAPNTFTGEDIVEISVHGSRWIQREMLADLIRRGARIAEPGEFTRRAYLNGRLDLAQAEGVADLIAASSKASHSLAISQTRGHFSKALDSLRLQLIDFASLLELELDFSEEDVEFADREKMLALSRTILKEINRLSNSYSAGSVLKEGIPVVIAGIPNAGKSSLMNLLLSDDKAIVSDIPGTTRDIIEDTIELDGYLYRFIDTAGLRESSDKVETIGIEKARNKMKNARIVIWLFDPIAPIEPQLQELQRLRNDAPDARIIVLRNKSDLLQGALDLSNEESTRIDSVYSEGFITGAPNSSDSVADSTPSEGSINGAATSGESFAASTASEGSITGAATSGESFAASTASEGSITGAATSGDLLVGAGASKGTHAWSNYSSDSVADSFTSANTTDPFSTLSQDRVIKFSTLTGEGLEELKLQLKEYSEKDLNPDSDIIVTNARHYEALVKGGEAMKRAIEGIENQVTGDFIAQDVREALHYLGSITGSITTPTLLQTIFSRFCIGK